MKIDKYKAIRIVLLPDRNYSEICAKFARKLSGSNKTYFVVDEKKYFSHITVYKAEFPVVNEKTVYRAVEDVVAKHRKLSLLFKKFYYGDGWFGIDFTKNRKLYDFHKRIIDILNPLREGHIRQKYFENWESFDTYRQKNIEKYGYPETMSVYHPHLTLCRFKTSGIDRKIADKLNKNGYKLPNTVIDQVAIVKSGDHGTVTKIVTIFKLK